MNQVVKVLQNAYIYIATNNYPDPDAPGVLPKWPVNQTCAFFSHYHTRTEPEVIFEMMKNSTDIFFTSTDEY